jgi:hypothetical protein
MKNIFVSDHLEKISDQIIDFEVDFSWRYDSTPAIHKVLLKFRDQGVVAAISDYDTVILHYMLKKPVDEYFFNLYSSNEDMLEHLYDKDDFIVKMLHNKKYSEVLRSISRH